MQHHPHRARLVEADLAKYDRLAARFRARQVEGASLLKAGIATKNAAFNRMIEQLEHVATRSRDPVLLTGETGTARARCASACSSSSARGNT